jgi:hypothetical protein
LRPNSCCVRADDLWTSRAARLRLEKGREGEKEEEDGESKDKRWRELGASVDRSRSSVLAKVNIGCMLTFAPRAKGVKTAKRRRSKLSSEGGKVSSRGCGTHVHLTTMSAGREKGTQSAQDGKEDGCIRLHRAHRLMDSSMYSFCRPRDDPDQLQPLAFLPLLLRARLLT